MGTRATYGFKKNGQYKMMYKHMEGHSDSLGKDVVDFIQSTSLELMHKIFDELILVNELNTPTPLDIELYKEYFWGSDNPENTDWYHLLNNTQGNLNVYKKGVKHMVRSDVLGSFYSYIINLDTNEFEYYYFSQTPTVSFPLDAIPEDWDDVRKRTFETVTFEEALKALQQGKEVEVRNGERIKKFKLGNMKDERLGLWAESKIVKDAHSHYISSQYDYPIKIGSENDITWDDILNGQWMVVTVLEEVHI